MNRTTTIVAFVLCLLLSACGNKGGLYLDTDEAVAEELRQLDESLDEIDDESVEKARKKAQQTTPSTN